MKTNNSTTATKVWLLLSLVLLMLMPNVNTEAIAHTPTPVTVAYSLFSVVNAWFAIYFIFVKKKVYLATRLLTVTLIVVSVTLLAELVSYLHAVSTTVEFTRTAFNLASVTLIFLAAVLAAIKFGLPKSSELNNEIRDYLLEIKKNIAAFFLLILLILSAITLGKLAAPAILSTTALTTKEVLSMSTLYLTFLSMSSLATLLTSVIVRYKDHIDKNKEI